MFPREYRRFASELQRFPEGFLGLVVLVSIAEIKLVGAFTNHVGAHVYRSAALFFAPGFRGRQKLRASPQAALRGRDNQRIYFRSSVRLSSLEMPMCTQPTTPSAFVSATKTACCDAGRRVRRRLTFAGVDG